MANWANLKKYSNFGPPLSLLVISATLLLSSVLHILGYRWAIAILLLAAAADTALMLYNKRQR